MVYIRRYYYVYILKCADGSYYTGVTNDIDRRLAQHQAGYNPDSYTFSRRPLELVYSEYFTDPKQAIAFEKQVKGWSRAKREALIAGDWNKIVELAKCVNPTSSKNRNTKISDEEKPDEEKDEKV
jgi:putative endonuclease